MALGQGTVVNIPFLGKPPRTLLLGIWPCLPHTGQLSSQVDSKGRVPLTA